MLPFLDSQMTQENCFEIRFHEIKAAFCLYFLGTMSQKKEQWGQKERGHIILHMGEEGVLFSSTVKQVFPDTHTQMHSLRFPPW